MASLLATYNLESKGCQNHNFTIDEFKNRYSEVYGDTIDI